MNRAGQFNTPFGRYKNPDFVGEKSLRAVSRYLNAADISLLCTDFEKALQDAEKGSFVYLDPPYDPVSDSANFTSYARQGFSREEQKRLKAVCDKLDKKGAKFLFSNAATEFIKDLYQDYRIEIIKARRTVNSNPEKRGQVDEVLIRNYDESLLF